MATPISRPVIYHGAWFFVFSPLFWCSRLPPSAGISDDVRAALARNNFSAAETELQSYRGHQGATPDYVEALSWMARASLQSNQLDRAQTYARQTESLSRQLLTRRPLDAEPHLPTALGAALEVQAQVLASRGELAQAVALLRHSLMASGIPPSMRDCKKTSTFWRWWDSLRQL